MIVDAIAALTVDDRVPHPVVHVQEAERCRARLRFRCRSRRRGIEVEKMPVDVDAATTNACRTGSRSINPLRLAWRGREVTV